MEFADNVKSQIQIITVGVLHYKMHKIALRVYLISGVEAKCGH